MRNSGSVIQEIQKRPFIRPLFFWITGILLQICFPLQHLSFAIPLTVVGIIVLSHLLYGKKGEAIVYSNRWVWGLMLAGIVIFLAIQMTALTELRLANPIAQEPGFLYHKAQEIQLYMVNKLDLLQLPDADKSVLATLTVDYRKLMTSEVRNQFSVTGVSHILSVSGFHVAIVCAFVNVSLSFLREQKALPRWTKYIVTMLCVWVFTYISGLSAAATRSAIMISIYLTGRVLMRNPDRYNTFAGAAFCMLVYNPFYLFDVGFQLSYTAVFFLLYLQPRFSKLIEIRNPIIANPWNVLTVTLSAQIGVCFLCFFYFGHSSAVFLFTNLLLSLLATVLIPATLVCMLAPEWFPGIGLLYSVVEIMARCMMLVVERFAAIPGATLSLRFDFFTMIFSYLSLGFLLLYFRLHRYWPLFAALASLLIILCWHLV